jgi:FkbM family methyltransferase
MKALFYPDAKLFEGLYIPEILHDIHMAGSYKDFFNDYHKDMIVLDFGANCGLTAHYFKEYAKKVYSVEPCPKQFEALKQNKEYNHWDNVEIFNMALAANNGQATFYTNRSNMTAGSLENPYYNALKGGYKYDNGIQVRTITIDSFFKENNIDNVDFMKMDIEGQEIEIIQSEGFKEVVPKIQNALIEFHTQDLSEYVRLMGFNMKRLPVGTVSYIYSRRNLWD